MTSRHAEPVMGPFTRLKRWGHELAALPPGYRFRTLHERHTAGPRGVWRRIAGISGGVVLVAVGLFELVVPGPGIVFILLGGALLAIEFRPVAAIMDVAEVRLRAAGHAAASAWRTASVAKKAVAVGVAAAGVGAAAWLALVLTRPLR